MIANPSKISKFIGMDVTSLMSVPLFIMEPFSMLQKMAEIMEYTELLDAADQSEDPYERCELCKAQPGCMCSTSSNACPCIFNY